MSMTPNNPFENQQDDQGNAQSPPPKKGYKGCLIGCGIAGILCVVVCCGGGAMMMQFVSSTMASEYQRQLTDDPVIAEHIGEINSMSVDWGQTFEESQKAAEQGNGEGKLVFSIEGSKSSGTIIVDPNNAGQGNLGPATLVMSDGTRHSIGGSGAEEAMEELDLDLDDMIDAGEAGNPIPIEIEN